MAVLFLSKADSVLNSLGKVRDGGSITFYESGTTTPLDTYSDDTLITANQNPITLFAGRPSVNIYLKDADYKVVFVSAAGTDSITVDPVHGGVGGALDVSDTNVVADSATTATSLKERFANVANVKDFGAKGDGSTDDTAAFVAAFATAKPLYVPYSNTSYLVNAGQLSLIGQNISGDGRQESVIECPSSTGALLTLGGTSTPVQQCRIEGIGLRFSDSVARSSGTRCLRISNAFYFEIQDVDLFQASVNLQAEDCLNFVVRDCYLRNGQIGANLVPGATYFEQMNMVAFDKCRFISNTLQAISGDVTGDNEFNQIVISGCQIEGNGTVDSGRDIINIANVGKTGCGPSVIIEKTWFEGNNGDRDVLITGNNTGAQAVLLFNTFLSTALGTANVTLTTCRVFSQGNGLNAPTVPKNIVFSDDTSGSSNYDQIGSSTNLGSIVITP